MRGLALSVVIDTYNHERYIERCVQSAVEQDFPSAEYEIIVVDDGSSDRTAEVAERFAPGVRVLRKKNGGQASAFNAGVAESRGEVVAFLDGDDWFASGKLTAVMEALERNPSVEAATHGYYEFRDETGEAKARVPDAEACISLETPDAAREANAKSQFLLVGGMTVRRRMLDRILPIPEELIFCADAPIALGSLAGGVSILKEPLFHYRHHAGNLYALSPNDKTRMRRRREMSDRAFGIVESLLRRLGTAPAAIRAFLYLPWIESNREGLRQFGGNQWTAFQTEMRAFQVDCEDPGLGYKMFKYGLVGLGALMLPPRVFYGAREWYGQKNMGRVRQRIFGGQSATVAEDMRSKS